MRRHLEVANQFQVLAQTRQEAVQDIVMLALKARGLSPQAYDVEMPLGLIKPKPQPGEGKVL